MSALHGILARAAPWLHHYGFAALVLAVSVEGIGIPAPGQTLLIGAALLAAKGEMSLLVVLGCALAATVAGDNLGYLIGRRGGRRLILRLGANRHRLVKLSRFYRRFGSWPVLADRFFDGARQIGSLLAGAATMSWPRFFVFDLIGALLWVGIWGGGMYQLERHVVWLHGIWTRSNPVIAGLSLIAVAALGFWLWRRRKASAA
jgi:membrane protein DedA with SNARE-associated domain